MPNTTSSTPASRLSGQRVCCCTTRLTDDAAWVACRFAICAVNTSWGQDRCLGGTDCPDDRSARDGAPGHFAGRTSNQDIEDPPVILAKGPSGGQSRGDQCTSSAGQRRYTGLPGKACKVSDVTNLRGPSIRNRQSVHVCAYVLGISVCSCYGEQDGQDSCPTHRNTDPDPAFFEASRCPAILASRREDRQVVAEGLIYSAPEVTIHAGRRTGHGTRRAA